MFSCKSFAGLLLQAVQALLICQPVSDSLQGKELRAARAQGLDPAPLGFGIGVTARRIPAIMTCP